MAKTHALLKSARAPPGSPAALEDQYPRLREREWILRIDGEDFQSVDQIVLPGQKLDILFPGGTAPSRSIGPWGGALGMR
jgi:hypothetical protein